MIKRERESRERQTETSINRQRQTETSIDRQSEKEGERNKK